MAAGFSALSCRSPDMLHAAMRPVEPAVRCICKIRSQLNLQCADFAYLHHSCTMPIRRHRLSVALVLDRPRIGAGKPEITSTQKVEPLQGVFRCRSRTQRIIFTSHWRCRHNRFSAAHQVGTKRRSSRGALNRLAPSHVRSVDTAAFHCRSAGRPSVRVCRTLARNASLVQPPLEV